MLYYIYYITYKKRTVQELAETLANQLHIDTNKLSL